MQKIEDSFRYLKGKRILVTGSMGYIGTNLCNFLLQHGASIDQWDLLNYKDVYHLTSDNLRGIDAIVHLAALSGVYECSENKKEAIYKNLKCAKNVLKVAYGEYIPLLFASSMAADEPESGFYATTKYLIEDEIFDINERYMDSEHTFPLMFPIRFANVYGGNDYLFNKKTVIANFINKLRKNENCIIHGDGEQRRDFIHVSEICRFILHLLNLKFMNMNDIHKDCNFYAEYFSPISLGTGIQHTINDIKEMFIKYHNFITNDNFEYDISASCGIIDSKVDTTNLEKIYKFKAKDYLDEYIRDIKI